MLINFRIYKSVFIAFLILIQPFKASSSALAVLDALGIPRPDHQHRPKGYSLNLVTSDELKSRLLAVFSRSAFYPSYYQLIQTNEMTYAIHEFFVEFYDEYSKAKDKERSHVINEYTNKFIRFIIINSKENNLALLENEIEDLRTVIYDLLRPRNTTCSKFLTK